MTTNREIQCEYSTTRSNENKCKALEIEFHNCLNILEQKKCPIYKLKQQLQAKEQTLDEIEKFIKNQLDEYGNDVYNMDKSAINSIQSIINKAKEQ